MRLNTVGLIVPLALSLLTAPLTSDAQQAGKIPQVGLLMLHNPDLAAQCEIFRQALHELGYIEGQTIVFEYRWAERSDQLPAMAAELVQRRVDVIVTWSTPAIHAAQQATTTIPIVMQFIGDPIASKLVESLARPGGNITGVTGQITGAFCGKLLELSKAAVPSVARVAALGSPAAHANSGRETAVAAQVLGIQLHPIEVGGPDEFESAFEAAAKEGAGALLLLPVVFFALNERRVAELAIQSRFPAIFWRRSVAEVGGLMAYGPRRPDMWRRVAVLVDKVLKGTKPADLPVEQAMRFELVINLKTAQALGLTIPPWFLYLADEVIE